MKNTPKRIAVVKATGDTYLVQQVNFERRQVHVWGEVVGYSCGKYDRRTTTREEVRMRDAGTKHETSKCFQLDAVELKETVVDGRFAETLMNQTRKNMSKKYR